MSVCYKWEHVWFGIDAWMPKYLKPEIVSFIGSRMGQDRAVWGTNGLPWKKASTRWTRSASSPTRAASSSATTRGSCFGSSEPGRAP